MSKHRFATVVGATAAALLLPLVASCSGGTAGNPGNRGTFLVTQISTGLAQIYPYRIRELNSFGVPTTNIVNIDSEQRLKDNVAPNNPVLPVGTFLTTPQLPGGATGNQFLLIRFSNELAVESILSPLPINQSTNSGLTTAISLVFENQASEVTTTLRGVGFVNGKTFANLNGQNSGNALVTAVEADANGDVTVLRPEFVGFPTGFNSDEDLVARNSFVFVADTDGDLSTPETFDPMSTGNLIRISVSNAVLNTEGQILEQNVCTATTVGPDTTSPQVIGYSGTAPVQISPGNGDVGVDPGTQITVRFNKPVQPSEVGTFFDPTDLTPGTGGVSLSVTAAANTFQVLYYADPVNFGNLCDYVITPSYILPGESPVNISIDPANVSGLNSQQLGQAAATTFTTGAGPGIVNAPVAPDVVYVGVGGAEPGVAVIDLNGFGQGTGDLNTTRFPLNPNLGAPNVQPNLFPGTSSLDAGGAGALTFTQDTRGNQLLLRSPTVGQVGDIHIGAPLDVVFNNGNINLNARQANQFVPGRGLLPGNSIVTAPHPNPPKLVFPPPNAARAIFGEEPTVTSSQGPAGQVITASPPCATSPINFLVAGNPFGATSETVGLFQHQFLGTFNGPQPRPASPPPPTPYCPFSMRQQIGHFLYILDRENEQILIVNSNRFTVLDTIELPSPFSMALSPTLAVLAVTNFTSSTVTLIDTNPFSPTFHQVIRTLQVPQGPTGIAYQPDNETLLVTSTQANTLTVFDTSDYSIVSQPTGSLAAPFELVVTQRYVGGNGNNSGLYYAYVLNGNGTIAAYESGPDGVNGIGFENIIGTIQPTFTRTRAILFDYQAGLGGFYVSHVNDIGLGVVSRVELTASAFGQTPLVQFSGAFILAPTFREKVWSVTSSYGGGAAGTGSGTGTGLFLSGDTITDMATDDMVNFGNTALQITQQNQARVPSGGSILGHSAKGTLYQGGIIAKQPRLLFIANSDGGSIDVIDLQSSSLLGTLQQPDVTVLSTYWRQ
jgi:hypothetical protein